MRITYWKHSGFSLTLPGLDILIDYIGGGYARGKNGVAALISHAHSDHRSSLAINIADIVIEGMAEGEKRPLPGAEVTAFGSTDEGVSFLIEANGLRAFHAGDLNFWHWRDESTPDEVAAARAGFVRVLETLWPYAGLIDAAMFPADPRMGESHAEGADMFMEAIRPKILIPMHFWDDAGAAKAYAASRKNAIALTKSGEYIDI